MVLSGDVEGLEKWPVLAAGALAAVCAAEWVAVSSAMGEQPDGRESAPPVALQTAPLAAP